MEGLFPFSVRDGRHGRAVGKPRWAWWEVLKWNQAPNANQPIEGCLRTAAWMVAQEQDWCR